MSAPNIVLPYGWVLLQQSASGLGLIFIDGKLSAATVALVYDTSDNLAVNDYVIYDSTKGIQVMYGSTIYVMIDEQYISGTEVLPP